MKAKIIFSVLIAVVLTISCFYFYKQQQPYITYQGCNLCDGNQYIKIYDYFEGKLADYEVSFPYHSRILVPALAAFLPGEDSLEAFQLLNLIFSLAGVLAILYLWHYFQIPWYLVLLGTVWLLFHWTGLIRLNALDPITTDVPLYVFQTLFIIILIRKKYSWLLWLGPLSVIHKESVIALMLAVLVYFFWYNRYSESEKIPLKFLLLSIVLTVLTKQLVNFILPSVNEGSSSVRLILFYLKEMALDPFRIFRWIGGLFTAFGPFILILIFNFKLRDFYQREKGILMILSIAVIALSVIGGQDHTRIAFLGFPFVMTWILMELKKMDWEYPVLMGIFSIPILRIFEQIPDPGQDFSSFALWYPEYAPEGIVTGGIAYISLFTLVLTAVHLLKRKTN